MRERVSVHRRQAQRSALEHEHGARLPPHAGCRSRPFTAASHDVRGPSQKTAVCRRISARMTETRSRGQPTRADLHCHSTASQVSKLGVQRALGLPECATPPEEVYELAKRRGMDFVTITDHDTIDGALEIADRPRRVRLRGADRLVPRRAAGRARALLRHHARRPRVAAGARRRRRGVRRVPARRTRSPARWPTRSTPSRRRSRARHRRRLAQLFPIWETRNGSRAPRAQRCPPPSTSRRTAAPASAASDDHAGVDIGRTFTETPPAATPDEFLAPRPRGEARGRAASRAAPRSGRTPRWRSRSARSARRTPAPRPTRAPS